MNSLTSVLPADTAHALAHTQQQPDFAVHFGPIAYLVIRLALYGLHVVSAGYFIGAGIVYQRLPGTPVAANLQLYSLVIPQKYFKAIGVVHYVLAAAHCLALAIDGVKYVAKAAIACFRRRRVDDNTAIRRIETHRKATTENDGTLHRLKSISLYVYASTVGRHGLFGVEGRHFDAIFLARELFETTLQSYQAYRMSRLLPRPILNRFYAAMLILNCWSTPMVKYFVRHKPTQRLLCMLSDIVLDFVSSVGIPVTLAISYIGLYNPVTRDLPHSFWYSDTSLVHIVNEGPLILFSSALDAISRLTFSISMLSCMEDVKELVRRKDRPRAKSIKAVIVNAVPSVSASQFTTTEIDAERTRTAEASKTRSLLVIETIRRAKLVKWAHRIMMVYGFAVLAFQLQAETKSSMEACVMELRPWLVSKSACALVEMNCHNDPTLSGNITDFNTILGDLDPLLLEHIVYRHCPHVEFGSQLGQFHNLIGMKLYNSTLVTWGGDAALTASDHPHMVFAFFVYTSFPNGSLPDGLLSFTFPRQLLDVEFIGTNLDNLPSDLYKRWPTGMNLLLERGLFTSFPTALVALQPIAVSLCLNHITDFTQEMLDMPATLALIFSGNPMVQFSESLNASASQLRLLYVDSTNMTTVPKWMDEVFLSRTYVLAGGTPFCDNTTSSERQQLLAERPHVAQIVCKKLYGSAFYPVYLEIRSDEIW